MIREAIGKVVGGEDLSFREAQEVMEEIMSGEATPAQIGALLVALRMKGEKPEEIAGMAISMRRKAVPVRPRRKDLVDTCGTGGDGAGTFNISTAAAFVVAGAGLGVAKHGNRSVSSRCGSADLVEALGIKLELPPEELARCIDEIGIAFLYAPFLHPAMKHATPPRREIGIRTVFNILGPLANPAQVKRQIIGVYDPSLTEVLAEVLRILQAEHALVIWGDGGIDELSLSGPNKITELKGGEIRTYFLDPQDLGLPKAPAEELRGGTPEENASLLLRILEGRERGPLRNAVLLNSAAALVAGGKAEDFREGLKLAAEALDSGAALAKLEALREFSKSLQLK